MDPAARRILGTIRAIHCPYPGDDRKPPVCDECEDDWPCMTLRAVEAAALGEPVPVHVHAVSMSWRPTGVPDVWTRRVVITGELA